MTIYELAAEYEQQYQVLQNKIAGVKPLLCIYHGQDLINLRRRIQIYHDMAQECRHISDMLLHYYEEDELDA